MPTTATLILSCIILATALSMSAAPRSSGSAPAETGFLLKSITHDGVEYKYAVYVPRLPPSAETVIQMLPTILSLHGKGECGTDGLRQLTVGSPIAVMRDCDRWPFLIVLPQKPDADKQWEDYDGPVMAMLEAARAEYRGDSDRTYLTGISQGGHGTWTLAAAHPDAFAAIAPICGYGDPESIAPKVKAIPTWCFHGEDDVVVPVEKSRDIVEAIERAGGSPKLTIYSGVNHNSWERAYADPDLATWLLEHRRRSR